MRTFLIAVSALVLATSCGGGASQNKVEGTEAQTVAAGTGQDLTVDATASTIDWVGSKAVGGQHNGTIAVKSGKLAINGEELVSGEFVIDMNSIKVLDLTEETGAGKLVEHLNSPDFFDVATYPESSFAITKAEKVEGNDSINYMISGNLKMRDVEKNISFGAKITKENDQYKAVSVPFSIDRTQWNVKYNSKSVFAELKDNVINDNIDLKLVIVANATK